MRVTIEKIVSQGDGLARNGKDVCFVPGVLEGEVVEVTEVNRRKSVVTCSLDAVITPSEKRIEPLCPHYGTCGGCNLQIVSPEEGVKIKEAIVLENLRRIGKVDLSSVTIDPPMTSVATGYRQRVRFQVDIENERIGFYARKSHDVVDIAHCPILVPALNSMLLNNREDLFSAAREKGKGPVVTVAALAGSDGTVSLGAESVQVQVLEKKLTASADVFFQNNVAILESIIRFMRTYITGERVVDLFSGVGTFAAFMESEGRETVAVERDSTCLSCARKNLNNTRFFTEDVESWGSGKHIGKVDTVIVDPPRSGLSPVAHTAIHAMDPQLIIYVSCDSATFSRDTASLREQGYALERIAFADMYPLSSHTETIALFTKKA